MKRLLSRLRGKDRQVVDVPPPVWVPRHAPIAWRKAPGPSQSGMAAYPDTEPTTVWFPEPAQAAQRIEDRHLRRWRSR